MVRRNYFSDVTSLLYGRVVFLLVNNTRNSILSAKSLLLSRQVYVLICGGLRYFIEKLAMQTLKVYVIILSQIEVSKICFRQPCISASEKCCISAICEATSAAPKVMHFSALLTKINGKYSLLDLKSKVKKVMFTPDKKPVAICRDQSRFKEIMSIFSNYERQVRSLVAILTISLLV